MGIFDFLKGKNNQNQNKEQTKIVDGYEIGTNTGIIYHCPRGLKQYILPNGSRKLSKDAFWDMASSAEAIHFPSSFTEFNCMLQEDVIELSLAKNLKMLHFSEGIKDIDLGGHMANLEFNIPQSVTSLKSYIYRPSEEGKLVIGNNVTEIEDLFASHDLRLQTVEIPGSITEVPSGAFNQCRFLKSVILHNGVKSVGKKAFYGTNNLNFVEIPESFSGNFEASTESRSGRMVHNGKIYSYTGDSYDEEMKAPVTINIKHKGKNYTFQICRGDFSELYIEDNIVSFNNGKIECKFEDLNPQAKHLIAEDKITSILPEQQEFKEGLRKGVTPPTQPKQQAVPQNNKTKTLRDTDLGNYNIKTVNKVINNIMKNIGYDESVSLGSLDESDRSNMSTTDLVTLSVAVHTKASILHKNSSDYLEKFNKIVSKLENEKVILPYAYMMALDSKKNGVLLRVFDSAVKEIETDKSAR